MTITRTLLKATAQFIAEPTQCVTQLNDLLAAENEQMMFVTLFYGCRTWIRARCITSTLATTRLICCAPMAACSPRHARGGMAVAVSEGMAYRAASVQLQPGSSCFCSPMASPKPSTRRARSLSEARLQQVLLQAQPHTRADPGALTAQVLAQVHAFENGAAQADDITCMALRFGGPAQPLELCRFSQGTHARAGPRWVPVAGKAAGCPRGLVVNAGQLHAIRCQCGRAQGHREVVAQFGRGHTGAAFGQRPQCQCGALLAQAIGGWGEGQNAAIADKARAHAQRQGACVLHRPLRQGPGVGTATVCRPSGNPAWLSTSTSLAWAACTALPGG